MSDPWSEKTKRHGYVHLTFDDGPHPDNTPKILDLLAKQEMKATFFVTGRHLREHHEIARRIFEEGHSLGGHACEHIRLTERDPEAWGDLILPVQEEIAWITSTPSRLFRPPYGETSDELREWCGRHGLETVLWDRDAKDWTNPGAEQIAAKLLDGVMPGETLLLHDAHHSDETDRSQTVEAVGLLLPLLAEQGLHSTAM